MLVEKTMAQYTSSSKGTLYFAYGSNLSTTQMQQRSPDSAKPLALARLTSYSWFICDRGYANVIAVPPGDVSEDTEATTVWGLVYLLTPSDETSLDGYEGWHELHSGGPNPDAGDRKRKPMLQGDCSYNKLYLLVAIEKWLVEPGELSSHFGIEVHSRAPKDTRLIRTLVYVDEVRTSPGRIKAEYIPRMSRAVKESIPLGIPESWVDRTMKQHGIVWWLGNTAGKRDKGDEEWPNEVVPRTQWEVERERRLLEGYGQSKT